MSDEHASSEQPSQDNPSSAAEGGAPKPGPGGVNPELSPEEQIAELREKLLRALADSENTRRRAEKDKQEAAKFGMTKFARELLSVADNLRRAIEAIPAEEREGASDVVKNLIAGVEMTEKELLSAFTKFSIQRVDSRGEKFDPNRHQAVAEIPGTGQPNGTVVEVFQVGYVMEDRLLRPAMVTVAKDSEGAVDTGSTPPQPAPPPGGQAGGGQAGGGQAGGGQAAGGSQAASQGQPGPGGTVNTSA